ncbi:AAA family ATPase [Salinarimonas chemoclinalis]|uniref:AAA family ATPase n=1 Tax=Salinarimonas chemoclinalis TaxID=3241599 RepID=UPI00355604D8
MIIERDDFFVLTGGPGAGKTTLIEALRGRGLACVPEAGRRIIQTQRRVGGRALPSADPSRFAEMELGIGLVSFCEADASRTTIFDRGLVDPIGYLTVCGLEVPAHFHEAARTYRYNTTVFIAPPWEEIYARDAERQQSFDLAGATHDAMVRVYGQAGYRLVPLPLAGVEERAAFVLDAIGAALRRTERDRARRVC